MKKSSLIFIILLYFTCIPLIVSSPSLAIEIRSFTFVGDGTSDRTVTDASVDFIPDVVWLLNDSTATEHMHTIYLDTMYASPAANGITWGRCLGSNIKEIVEGGIRVGSSCNGNGWTYTVLCFKSNVSGDMCIGYYEGDGSASRTITTGMAADFVFVKRHTTNPCGWFKFSFTTDNFCMADYYGAPDQANDDYIVDITDTGFTVGLQLNNSGAPSGVEHSYMCLSEISGFVAVDSVYVPNSDDNDFTGYGFQPDHVFAKAVGEAEDWFYKVLTMDNIDESGRTRVGYDVTADAIQDFISGGFQLGNIYSSNTSWHVLMVKEGDSSEAAGTTGRILIPIIGGFDD